MRFKLFIFLALLFAVFLLSSAAEAEKSKDETKPQVADEVNQVDDAKYYRCRYRCCGHYGCRCCTVAEIMAEESNLQNNVKYQASGYGGGGYGGRRGGGGYGGGGHGGYGGGGGHGGYGGGGGHGGYGGGGGGHGGHGGGGRGGYGGGGGGHGGYGGGGGHGGYGGGGGHGGRGGGGGGYGDAEATP